MAIFIATIIGLNHSEVIDVFSTTKKEIPIYNVARDDKAIAITFDVAWDDKDTKRIMDTLEKYGVKASFFIVGEWIDKYPDSVKALAAAGHEILNHANTHPHMTKLTPEQMKAEILDCDAKIFKVTGKSLFLFRPPYGEYNNTVVSAAKDVKHLTIQWDVDSLDWKDLSPQKIVERVSEKTKSGSIILLHVGAKNTPDALPLLIEKLKEKDFNFVPVSQLIYRENYTIDQAGKQIKN